MALPTLHTRRLALRPVRLDDVDALHALWIDRAVRRYLWDDAVISRERAEETVRSAVELAVREPIGLWVVRDRENDAPAGFCGFVRREHDDSELLYGLAPACWGRGLATDAARAAVAYAFDVAGIVRVTAATDPPNLASVRVVERLGMRFTHRGGLNGLDTLFYELRREDVGRPEGRPLPAD